MVSFIESSASSSYEEVLMQHAMRRFRKIHLEIDILPVYFRTKI